MYYTENFLTVAIFVSGQCYVGALCTEKEAEIIPYSSLLFRSISDRHAFLLFYGSFFGEFTVSSVA